MPFAAPCESFCQPDMQWARGGGCEHRQLPAPAAAPLRLGNLLRVFEPRQPKARKIGAVFLSWLLPLDSWSLLAPSPGSIPTDGLRLAAAMGYMVPCLLRGAQLAFPSRQGTDSSSAFKIRASRLPQKCPDIHSLASHPALDPASRGAQHSQTKCLDPKATKYSLGQSSYARNAPVGCQPKPRTPPAMRCYVV